MDVIATHINTPYNGAFINADGSKTFFIEETDYLSSAGDPSISDNHLKLATTDLDGNGFNDIIISDGDKIHAYYNLGQITGR